jgi:predicted transposase/invertase (TIGR01784 family)
MYYLDDPQDDGRFYNLTNDMVFKIVFSSPGNERLLAYLLNALLKLKGKKQIESLEILNPFNIPEFRKDKNTIIDVRAKDRTGKRYCIEVQMRAHKELMKRIIYYSSVSYARQLSKGGQYADLNKTICLWIMGESIIENSEIYNKYLISHSYTHEPLTDLIEYHFVELSKFNKNKPANLRTKFEKWLHLLKFGELYQTLDDLPNELKKEKIAQFFTI